MLNKTAFPANKLWRTGLLAAVLATAVNLAIFFIGKLAFDVPFVILRGGPGGPLMPMPALIIVIFNVGAALGATAILALLAKYSDWYFRIFWILSIAVFLISFMLPIGLPESVASSTRFSLALMHFPAAAIIVGMLSRLRP